MGLLIMILAWWAPKPVSNYYGPDIMRVTGSPNPLNHQGLCFACEAVGDKSPSRTEVPGVCVSASPGRSLTEMTEND